MNAKIKDGPVTSMSRLKTKRLEKSKPDSERDSGFSDASSEHLSVVDQTDSEDAGRPVVPGSRSKPSQLAVIGGSFQNLSPMIIMNNVLLKQPGDNSTTLKQWGFSSAVEVVQQPQVVFLQPVISQRKTSESKGPLSKRRKHKKYIPIMKSYPKIAPHPGDSPRSTCSSSTSDSSSRTTASVRSTNSSSTSWECPQVDKQRTSSTPNPFTPARHRPASPLPQTDVTESNTGSFPAKEKTATVRLGLIAEPTDVHAKVLQSPSQATSNDDVCENNSDSDSSKRKRFCNTYNILSKSGLLGITLRTKDLIRQNRRTQAEIDKLREHTNLFVEALQKGDLHIWSKLQLSMEEESEKGKTLNTGQEST